VKDRNFIVVLNDRSTWTALPGCRILEITDEGMSKLEWDLGSEPKHLPEEYILKDVTIEHLLKDKNDRYGALDKTPSED
jgi:hypothetical protein